MRASQTFFSDYSGAENFTWLESVMSQAIGSTLVYRGETLECSPNGRLLREKESIHRVRLGRKLTLLLTSSIFFPPDALLEKEKKAKSGNPWN